MSGNFLSLDAFPIVRVEVQRLAELSDYDAFEAEWADVTARGAPFVLIAIGTHPPDGSSEIRQRRAEFFKSQMSALQDLCLASYVVICEDTLRMQLNEKAEAVRRNLGAEIQYVASEEQAWDKARARLSREV